MGLYIRVENPLAESTPFQSGEPSSSTNKAPASTTQQKSYNIFQKNQDRLKLQPFFEILNERFIRESGHTVTLKSGKVVHSSKFSTSLAGFDSEVLTTLGKSSPTRPTDPRKKAALQATSEILTESTPRRPLGDVTGTVNNPI